MGSGASVQNEIPKEWMDIFKAMKLKPREVQKLYNIYNTVDADRSGSIDVTELLMFMDIERSLFTQRIFEAFDKDHTHRVDFYEFVVSAWKFCALGKEATCKQNGLPAYQLLILTPLPHLCSLLPGVFAFDLYDLNADGKLTSSDVVTMFRELLGAKALEQEAISRYYKSPTLPLSTAASHACHVLTTHTHRVLAKLMKEAAANEDCITVDFFRSFTNVHQALLLPVFGIQNMLRISTLGVAFWDRMSRRRIELRPGVMVPLSELMVLVSLVIRPCVSFICALPQCLLFYSQHAHRKLFGAIMENKHSMGRVSSMMRIVLDNTNNAVQHDTPPPSPKATQRNTKILNPFAGIKPTAAAPAGPVMVHGNFVTSTPSSPTSSYRISVVGGGGVGAGLGGGGLGGVGYPAAYSPHAPPVAASSPRTVVASSGSASSSPSQAQAHSKHHAHSHSPDPSPHGTHGGHSSGHGEHHAHSTHSTHGGHSGHGNSSERSAHLHSSHSTSSGHSHHGHSQGHAHNERSDGHHHHSHSHNKEHSPHESHSHHSHHSHHGSAHHQHHHVEHSSSRSHTEAGSTGSISVNSTTGHSPHTKHHLTPAQLLQSHPHAKRTSTDKPPL